MSWCPYFITIACALLYAFASPVGRADTSLSTTRPKHNSPLSARAWSWTLEDLAAEFKGIHWDYAFSDCTPDQLDKVIFSTRAAQRMLVLVANDEKYPYSAAWNRYFGDYPLWYKSGAQFLAVAAQIQHNIRQVARFPKHGHFTKTTRKWKIQYTCRPQDHITGTEHCENGARAWTMMPDLSKFEAWTIGFCPSFFEDDKLKYLEERTNDVPKPYGDIAFLDTYERVIVHEYMHNDIVKFKPGHIEDLKGQLIDHGETEKIYGESRCRDFARKWITRIGGQVNRKVVSNADGYAWFFMYHWFDNKWNWHRNPHDELKKAQAQSSQATIVSGTEPATKDPDIGILLDDFPRDENDVPTSDAVPENCEIDENNKDENGVPAISCAYIGGDEEAWNDPFQSAGGCELSYRCRTPFAENAVDPLCECTCDGKRAALRDKRCAGFAGALPGRPIRNPRSLTGR